MRKSEFPLIRTELPGPNARQVLEDDEKYISPSYTRSYPLVIDSGDGLRVTDVDGNQFLDFTSGIAVNSTGHSHPVIVEVIKRQAEKFIHMSGTDFYYESEVKLARLLSDHSPGDAQKRVFFTNSGAESVEAAIKLARYRTSRGQFLSFYGSFHGRTMGALSLSASKSLHKEGFSPLMPGVQHAPYAYCYRCPYGLKRKTCSVYCVTWIEETLFKTTLPPSDLAAIFVEPIQGEGGYIVPPDEFITRLFQLARKYDVLIVMDEIQAGMGRTGKLFASEHFGVEPDIITLAKGIASGLPLGAMIARSDLMTWVPGAHANTFGGNPIACEAAISTIGLLQGGLIENAQSMGKYMIAKLQKLQDRYEIIGDVRGKGLMIGVELVKNRDTKEMAVRERDEIVQRCFKKGLLVLGAGTNVIRFIPSLNVSEEEVDIALEIFSEALGDG